MKNSDQPAYPNVNRRFDQDTQAWVVEQSGGLTKREKFAAMAMQSILEAFGRGLPGPTDIASNARGEPTTAGELYSEAAIGYADALLAELDKDNVCEWRHDGHGKIIVQCCQDFVMEMSLGDYCHYCGRKIKEVK